MWTAIFIIVIMASIGLALVAALSPQTKNTAPQEKNRWSLIAALTAGCRDLSRMACAAFDERKRPHSDEMSVPVRKAEPTDAQLPNATLTAFLEPALLPRRMRHLQIDLEEFFCSEPLLFRELAARCRHCASATQCERDLADPWASDDPWEDYCPHASVLNAVSAFGGVGSRLPTTADSTASSTSGDQARAAIRH